jgi:hypothetical protein
MKRLISVFALCMITFTAVGSFASPKKDGPAPAPATKTPPTAQEDASLSGKVAETMNTGGYTYVLLEKNGKKTWAAIPAVEVKVGQELTLQPGVEMKNFTSKTLNRMFESIIFSGGPRSKPSQVAENKPENSQHGAGAAAASKPAEKISVEKAAGPDAYTVSEVHEKIAALNEKTAVVKGKVVKVSGGIMGKNWVHLQDGSGDAALGTNKLVTTSDDLPAVGDIITMKGTIYQDKDFGAGYKYHVIMEKASIQR